MPLLSVMMNLLNVDDEQISLSNCNLVLDRGLFRKDSTAGDARRLDPKTFIEALDEVAQIFNSLISEDLSCINRLGEILILKH